MAKFCGIYHKSSCCLTAHGECPSATLPKNSDAEQRRREKILLCNASRMFIDWNVTFRALQKRAMKANATITTILENFGSYKRIDTVRAKAKEAFSGVRDAMNKTTAALATARDFMNGIERDFFNVFEAIKHEPHTFTFGHSNLNLQDENKRVSEVLTLFNNFTNFFAECERTVGRYETYNAMELKVMQVVDSANLTNWKTAQIGEWKSKLERVKPWLECMRSYTKTSRKTNVWNHSVTILNIIKEDCNAIKANVVYRNYPNYLDSAVMNILRHLRDIGDSNVTDSLHENGCAKIRKHFVELAHKNVHNRAYENSKEEVKKMCGSLFESENVYDNCSSAKDSFEWIFSRFNTTVPKMVMYLNYSLAVLSDAEAKIKNTSREIVEDARELVCNMSNRMNSIHKAFNEHVITEVGMRMTSNISLVVSKLNKNKSLTDAVESTEKALDVILKADTTAGSSGMWAEKARSTHDNMLFMVEKTSELNKRAGQMMERIKRTQSELKRHNGATQRALLKGSEHTHELAEKFTAALNLTADHDKKVFEDVGDCFPVMHVTSSMTADKAAEVIERLARSRLGNVTEDLSVPLQICEREVGSLKNIIAQVDSNCSGAQEIAAEIDRMLGEVEEQSKKIQQLGLQAVVSELKRRREALCVLRSQLHTLTLKLESLKDRDGKAVRTISELRRTVDSSAVAASEAEMRCEGIGAALNKAAVLRPEAAIEGQTSLDAHNRCAEALKEVAIEGENTREVIKKAEEIKEKLFRTQHAAKVLLDGKEKELSSAMAQFSSLIHDTADSRAFSIQNMCNTYEFSQHVKSFENALLIASRVPNVVIADISDVVKTSNSIGLLAQETEDILNAGQTHASLCGQAAKLAKERADRAENHARKALKELLEKQRSELCDVMTRLGEINRNTSLLMQQAQNAEENATAERLRAEWSSEAAREAADRSASATVYASEAVKKRKETGEAVWATRRGTRILVRSGMTVLSMNEKQIHKINGTLASAFLNITKEKSRTPLIPCDTQFEFNVTEDLTGALGAIERLGSLTNASYALAALNALQQSGRQVVRLARQAKESADAAEQASKAAQKAAEDSKCTPLYLQLFHMLGHDG